jgi:hypothetical protein
MSVRHGSEALIDPKQLSTQPRPRHGSSERLAAAASECLGVPAATAQRLAEEYVESGNMPDERTFLRWIGARRHP